MSGHSKWATTKHKKAVVDAKRGKLFAKLIKNVEVAARTGGGDPAGNPTLFDAIQKAKKSSVPNDNIDRAVRRGSGVEAGGAAVREHHLRGLRSRWRRRACRVPDRQPEPGRLRGAHRVHPQRRLDGRPGSVAYLFHRKGVVIVEKTGRPRTTSSPRSSMRAPKRSTTSASRSRWCREPTDLVARARRCRTRDRLRLGRLAFLPSVEVELDEERRQAGLPDGRGARGLRRRSERLCQLLRLGRHHGAARLTSGRPPRRPGLKAERPVPAPAPPAAGTPARCGTSEPPGSRFVANRCSWTSRAGRSTW